MEAKIYSDGRELWAQLHNKVVIEYMGGKQPYRRRLPLDCSLPTAEKIKLVSGSMTRIKQVVHRQQDLLHCLVDLRVETMTALYSKKVYRKAVGMQVLSASDCLNEKEKEAMIISSLMTEEQTLGLYFDFNGP